MRLLLGLFVVGVLGMSVTACGSGTKDAASKASISAASATTSTTPSYAKADADKDNDVGAPGDDTNNNSVLDFGHAADAVDRRAATNLVGRYYAAAAAGDGAAACTMLYSTLAEAVPEDYGQVPGPSYLRGGKTCPAVMDLLFKHFHSQLMADEATLKVVRVRLIAHHGLVVLSFGRMPEREISVGREGHTWRVEDLLDGELP